MGNIGFGELAIICIVLIIAVGPERLPAMMKTFGKTMRTLRQASRDIRASTGIDELMREDFDIQPAPRRPFVQPPVEGPPVGREAQVAADTATPDASLASEAANHAPPLEPAVSAPAAITPPVTTPAAITPPVITPPVIAPAAPSDAKAEPDPSKHGA
jgi:Tat protein translocase TatB subunit